MNDAIIPVGKDCDCGHPMIWRNGAQLCAVYGTHPSDEDRVMWRNHNAPGAELIKACMDAPNLARRTRHLRAVRTKAVA